MSIPYRGEHRSGPTGLRVGVVVLPEGGHGPMRALCGPCRDADPESAAAAGERGVSFVEAFLLALAAAGCRPQAVVGEAAA